jgi:O-antigen/teichoic acid export membrane protein
VRIAVGDSTEAGPPGAEAVPTPVADDGRFDPTTDGGRRGRAARGTLVNSAFLIGLNLLGLVKGFAVAGFVSASDYGVWGLLIISFTTLYGLVQIGVDDKYIQQDAADQEQAFELAFTLQLVLTAAFVLLMVVAMPLFALAYGNWEVVLPGWALALAIPATAFQTPLWTFYRRLDYGRQRRLELFDPVVGLVLTVGLAAAGLGYWAFVVGTVAGAWAAALVAVRASPYRLRLRFDRGIAREYATFSAPLLFQGVCAAAISFGPVLTAQRALGTAAVGAIAIANNISLYANKVDEVITTTLYPVICAVKDRRDLLLEAFLKSNRMGLLWATPMGLGIALFGPDLVHFVLGTRWVDAISVIQAFGLIAALNQIGFNWTSFFRALGDTRPIAVGGGVMALAVTALAIPLILVAGLTGFVVGLSAANALLVATRIVYLRRLFALRPVLVNVARGILPGMVGFGLAGTVRLALWGGVRSEGNALVEIVVFLVAVGCGTALLERGLLREFRGYLRGAPAPVEQAG